MLVCSCLRTTLPHAFRYGRAYVRKLDRNLYMSAKNKICSLIPIRFIYKKQIFLVRFLFIYFLTILVIKYDLINFLWLILFSASWPIEHFVNNVVCCLFIAVSRWSGLRDEEIPYHRWWQGWVIKIKCFIELSCLSMNDFHSILSKWRYQLVNQISLLVFQFFFFHFQRHGNFPPRTPLWHVIPMIHTLASIILWAGLYAIVTFKVRNVWIGAVRMMTQRIRMWSAMRMRHRSRMHRWHAISIIAVHLRI